MVNVAKVQEILDRTARRVIGPEFVERTLAEPTTDSQGEDAFRVVIVLKPHGVEAMSGDQTLDMLSAIRVDLEREGEERLAIIEYATEEDLAQEEEASSEAIAEEEGERRDD